MEQKLCKGTKNVQGNKKYAQGAKNDPSSRNKAHKDQCGRIWPHVVVYGLVWPYVAFYGLV